MSAADVHRSPVYQCQLHLRARPPSVPRSFQLGPRTSSPPSPADAAFGPLPTRALRNPSRPGPLTCWMGEQGQGSPSGDAWRPFGLRASARAIEGQIWGGGAGREGGPSGTERGESGLSARTPTSPRAAGHHTARVARPQPGLRGRGVGPRRRESGRQGPWPLSCWWLLGREVQSHLCTGETISGQTLGDP